MTAAGRPIRGDARSFSPRRGSRCRSSRSISAPCSRSRPPITAINPLQRVPALVLDDGTVITESIAICRYFEALKPDPPLFGRGALGDRAHRDVEPAARAASAVSGLARLSQLASGDEGDGGAAGAGLGRGQQAAHPGISRRARPRARQTVRSSPATHYTVADITGLVAVDFMKPAKLARAGRAQAMCKRWHADVSARPSAAA